MKSYQAITRTVLSLVCGVLGALFIGVNPAHAQAAISTLSVAVKGHILPQDSGLKEAVKVVGNCSVTSKVVTDPTLGPSAVVTVDCRGLSITGDNTGASYQNTGIAILSRPFAATDTVITTFPVYRDPTVDPKALTNAGAFALTLNLAYDATTDALTSTTSSLQGVKTYLP